MPAPLQLRGKAQVGAVVDGIVRRVEEFGAFVGINGMKVSGLLHISNISRARVDATKVCLARTKISL